jgi:hypothetical protein
MTIKEAYDKLESALPRNCTFTIDMSINRSGYHPDSQPEIEWTITAHPRNATMEQEASFDLGTAVDSVLAKIVPGKTSVAAVSEQAEAFIQ